MNVGRVLVAINWTIEVQRELYRLSAPLLYLSGNDTDVQQGPAEAKQSQGVFDVHVGTVLSGFRLRFPLDLQHIWEQTHRVSPEAYLYFMGSNS